MSKKFDYGNFSLTGCEQGGFLMKTRLLGIGLLLSVLFVALSARLAFVQIVLGQEYRERAQERQQIPLTGLAIRGVIYDRNMRPLTNKVRTFLYFVPKDRLENDAKMLLEEIGAKRIGNRNTFYYVYQSERRDEDVSAELAGRFQVFEFSMDKRYEENQSAEHMIGYVNVYDNKGQMGMEKAYDELLRFPDESYYLILDGMRRILPGYGVNLSQELRQTGLVTTLDEQIQQKTEQIMEKEQINGSVVVLDTKTGDLLAAVSTPSYDPNRVQDYIDGSDGELINKTIQGEYAPGSVFKMVTAAAALESGRYTKDSVFFCKGYEEINGVRIACTDNHGEITLQRAFAVSCNAAMIQIGQKIGGDTILSYAAQFGLGQKTLSGFAEEKPGNLPQVHDTAGAGVGNLAIGQGKLLATPVQIARMTNVIASGGIDRGVRVVTAEMRNGTRSKEYDRQAPRPVISEQSAKAVKEMMIGVVESGTGDNIRLLSGLTAGGKTSSAQSADKGEKVVHAWFSGFAPADQPQYTITVFVQNGASGRQSAAPVFEKLVNAIAGTQES